MIAGSIQPHGVIPGRRGLITAGSLAIGASLALGASADAATFTVTNLNDSGSGSLRDALNQANGTAEPDTVTFASGLTGTIHLASQLGAGPYPVAIEGPGASLVTISGGGTVRDFFISGSAQPRSFSISGLTITGGADTSGAGIESLFANLTISNSVITGNTTTETGSTDAFGGGIDAFSNSSYPRTLTIDHSTVSNNRISSPGGSTNGAGLSAKYHTVNITDSTVSGNTAVFAPGSGNNFGGGLYVDHGPLQMSGSTIANNTGYSGGGMRVEDSIAPSSIADSTIAGNNAPYGGGIRWPNSNGPHPLTITGTTIAGNGTPGATVGFGGGIADTANTHMILRDSIVSGNTAHAGPDLYNSTAPYTTTSGFDTAFSLIGDPSAATVNETVAGSNIVGQSPQLGPLADNGGPVQTMALPGSSPAVDKGSAFGLASDARGVLRPIDFPDIANSAAAGADGADIGAFELQPSNAFTLGKLKRNRRKGRAVQTVNLPVPDAGTVTLTGKGLKKQTKLARAAGVLKLKVIPKRKLKRALKRRGRAKTKETVTYNPTGQTEKTITKKIKLLKRRR